MKKRKEKDVNRLYLIIRTTQKCQTNRSSEFSKNDAIALYNFCYRRHKCIDTSSDGRIDLNEDLIFKTTTGKRISAIEELRKPSCS